MGDLADALRAQAAVLLALADAADSEPSGAPPQPDDARVARATPGPPVRTLRSAIRRGELPAVRVGRSYMVTRSDLDVWLDARRVQPRPPVRREPSSPAERAIARARRDGTLRVVGGGR